MFFILNTGRSGSQTLAQVLTQAPACVCLHEPHPRIIELSSRFRYGAVDGRRVADVLRSRPLVEAEVYGETANRLALVVPVLRAVFPDARLVWLVRDGRSYVASQLQRGAFGAHDRHHPTEWTRWRLRGDLAGEVDPAVWRAADPFEKLCWQWSAVNRWIEHDTADAPPFLVRVEELPHRLPALVRELRLPPATFVVPRANRRRDASDRRPDRLVRAADGLNVREVEGWQGWSETRRRTFERWCGPQMDRLYPGWRDAAGTWHDVESGPTSGSRSATVEQIGEGRSALTVVRVDGSPPLDERAARDRLRIAALTVALHEERSAREELERRRALRWHVTHRLPRAVDRLVAMHLAARRAS
jgi:hypothetical protein